MSENNEYTDRRGDALDLSTLDRDERELVAELLRFANAHPDARTAEYWNFYPQRVGEFYEARGLTRKETTRTLVWRIAQDINGRLLVAAGLAKDSDDYREKLDALIRDKYGSRREFCELTGISEDMLSHVLAKRKHMSIQSLSSALAKIGYTIQITQMPDVTPPSSMA
ncbi:MAG: hypothetical protein WD971_02410 [Pirellulales bacterium]